METHHLECYISSNEFLFSFPNIPRLSTSLTKSVEANQYISNGSYLIIRKNIILIKNTHTWGNLWLRLNNS